MLLHPDGSEELLVAGGDGLDHRSGGLVRRPVGLLRPHPQPARTPASGARRGRGRHLQDPRADAEDRAADEPAVHAQHRRGRLDAATIRTPRAGQDALSTTASSTWGRARCPAGGSSSPATATAFGPPRAIPAIALQLFVMDDRDESIGDDDDPTNLEKIGHLNIAGALHPVVLDGRPDHVQLARIARACAATSSWGIWTIHPDGTNWDPLVSAFDPGGATERLSLSDAALATARSSSRSTTTRTTAASARYIKLPPTPPDGYAGVRPGVHGRPAQRAVAVRPASTTARAKWYRMPFMPTGSMSLTPFAHRLRRPGRPRRSSATRTRPQVGKFTHPSGAPDNHLLTV